MSNAPFCRDCLTLSASPLAERCSACGSPRLLQHKERDSLSIAHVDCDAFFASVEKRETLVEGLSGLPGPVAHGGHDACGLDGNEGVQLLHAARDGLGEGADFRR